MFGVSFEDVRKAVRWQEGAAKKRLELSADGDFVRACQGHSSEIAD